MAEVTCTIGRTEIKKIDFNKELKAAPNQKVQLQIKTNFKVGYNPEKPLEAVVFTNVTIADEETQLMHLIVETITPVAASSFVDNLDAVVRREYVPTVLTVVAEKVKDISTYIGIPIMMPPAKFPLHADGAIMGS